MDDLGDTGDRGADARMPDENAEPDAALPRVLIVEDGPDNRRLLQVLLKKLGCTTETAENGRLGVDAVAAARDRGERFALILMDMQMPVMDGPDATRAIRELGDDTPVVAVTANAMAEDRERCLAAGCDDFLTKPIDRTALADTVTRFTGAEAPDRRAA